MSTDRGDHKQSNPFHEILLNAGFSYDATLHNYTIALPLWMYWRWIRTTHCTQPAGRHRRPNPLVYRIVHPVAAQQYGVCGVHRKTLYRLRRDSSRQQHISAASNVRNLREYGSSKKHDGRTETGLEARRQPAAKCSAAASLSEYPDTLVGLFVPRIPATWSLLLIIAWLPSQYTLLTSTVPHSVPRIEDRWSVAAFSFG